MRRAGVRNTLLGPVRRLTDVWNLLPSTTAIDDQDEYHTSAGLRYGEHNKQTPSRGRCKCICACR